MADSDFLSTDLSAPTDASESRLQSLKDRSAIRRKLLAQSFGVASTTTNSTSLFISGRNDQKTGEAPSALGGGCLPETKAPLQCNSTDRRASTPIFRTAESTNGLSVDAANAKNGSQDDQLIITAKRLSDSGSNEHKTKRRKPGDQSGFDSDGDEIMEPFDDYFQVLQEEEKIFRGSATFLKGTQSANPHNDYSQHFIDTGQRPQNFIRDSGLAERFDEYPKLKELIKLKDELVATTATPPMYLKCDLRTYDLREIGSRFDVILIEPPLEEYHISGRGCWSWDHIEQLDVAAVADARSFLWLWCGSTPEGLQRGRDCLKRWGFRRCEDISWVKTNKSKVSKEQQEQAPGGATRFGAGHLAASNSLLQRSKEHCLMGIKGTVRRSNDGDFIHANVDIDLIITEEAPAGSIDKPLEIVLIAEHFCLGRRRLHLFGRDDTIRPGWLTVGPELTSSNFDAARYRRFFDRQAGETQCVNGNGGYTTGCTERIELLRPKSPVPMDKRIGGGAPAMSHALGNQTARADGLTGANTRQWQRTSNAGNVRGRIRSAVPGRGYPDQLTRYQKDQRTSDSRNGMTADHDGRFNRYSSRLPGSDGGSNSTFHGKTRLRDAKAPQFGIRRKF